jgi:hypothetical protein
MKSIEKCKVVTREYTKISYISLMTNFEVNQFYYHFFKDLRTQKKVILAIYTKKLPMI